MLSATTDPSSEMTAAAPRGRQPKSDGDGGISDVARIVAALACDYPVLRHYLGALRFNAIAHEFIAAQPVQHPFDRQYCKKFPIYLSASGSVQQEIMEIAALERAMSDAFEEVDMTVLDRAFEKSIAQEQLRQLRFKPHTSLRTLLFHKNTCSIWAAIKCEELPPPVSKLATPQHVMVWRQANQARMRLLSDDEFAALSAMQDGKPFSNICDVLAMRDKEEDVALRAATYLRGWLEAEILSEANWAVDLK